MKPSPSSFSSSSFLPSRSRRPKTPHPCPLPRPAHEAAKRRNNRLLQIPNPILVEWVFPQHLPHLLLAARLDRMNGSGDLGGKVLRFFGLGGEDRPAEEDFPALEMSLVVAKM